MGQGALSGQIALVTGGSRGIGRAVCMKLSQLGATVVVNYQSRSKDADEVVAEIQKLGGQAKAMGFDVSKSEQVEEAVKQVLSEFGKIDVLINNAGIAIDSLVMRMKDADWEKTIAVNLTGCFNLCKSVSKAMLKARSGRIVNISSVVGEMGNAGQVAYSASKSGIFGLTKSLSRELASRGVTVNAVAPGYIKTDMTAGINEEAATALMAQIPLGRLGDAEDVASAVAFLSSPESSYITGQILSVNGGMYM